MENIIEIEEDPLKIYYWACIFGGEDSYNPLVHHVCDFLLKRFDFNPKLYSPSGSGFKKMKLTNKKIFNNFKKKFADFPIKNEIKFDLENKLYDMSLNIRGFTDSIQLIYQGNAREFGRVPDYIINKFDLTILKNLMKNKDDLINRLQIYFQTYQQFHGNKLFWYNHQGLFYKNGIEIDFSFAKDFKYTRGEANYTSNLITSLFNMGDCREHALIYALIKEIENLENFNNAIDNNNFHKVEEIIKNNYRIFNINIYYNSHYTKDPNYYKFLPTYEIIKDNDELNSFEKENLKFGKFIYAENHNNIGLILDNTSIHFFDVMYNNNYKKLNKEYLAEYTFDDRIVSNIKNNIVKIKSEGVLPDIEIVLEFIPHIYNIIVNKNPITNIIYLNNNIKLPRNFYEIDKFVIQREIELHKLRQNIFKKNIKVNRFKKSPPSKFTEYLLLEDL
jgi:hypothetical protein